MNKSLEYGRTDVEWWMPLFWAVTIWVAFFCQTNDSVAEDLLNFAKACLFGFMGYAGFWIAGRTNPNKKYVNWEFDLLGGGLMGMSGLVGVVMSLSNHLPNGRSHREAISPPIILLGAWWLVAIYYVWRRQVIIAQQENERG